MTATRRKDHKDIRQSLFISGIRAESMTVSTIGTRTYQVSITQPDMPAEQIRRAISYTAVALLGWHSNCRVEDNAIVALVTIRASRAEAEAARSLRPAARQAEAESIAIVSLLGTKATRYTLAVALCAGAEQAEAEQAEYMIEDEDMTDTARICAARLAVYRAASRYGISIADMQIDHVLGNGPVSYAVHMVCKPSFYAADLLSAILRDSFMTFGPIHPVMTGLYTIAKG